MQQQDIPQILPAPWAKHQGLKVVDAVTGLYGIEYMLERIALSDISKDGPYAELMALADYSKRIRESLQGVAEGLGC